jgi:NAD-dependent dihydropyrimidine dehydrogenase PreA subunit
VVLYMIICVEKCMHCGACVGSCPENAIFLNEIVLEFNDKCNRCGRCVRICPSGALKMEGKK